MIVNPGSSYRRFLPYLALFILPTLLYYKTTGFEFIPSWDDADYVLNNPFIKELSVENIKGAFSNVFVSNYAPIHILSYMIDHSLWGLNPFGYHLTNIILHSINTLLLYTFIHRATGRAGVSFATALLFSVHPLNIENVAWVSERKTLLTTFFSLFALLYYESSRNDGSKKDLYISLALFTLAVLSKPLAVILPLVITFYEFCIFRKTGIKRLGFLLPYYLISFAGAMLSLWAHKNSGALGVDNLSGEVLWGTVYPTMIPVFWKYIYLIAFPFKLSGYYDTELYSSWFEWPVAIALITWTVLFAIILLKGSREVKFWFIWFWIWLLPVSNIIPIYVYYADRYMYMPLVGIFVLYCLLINSMTKESLDGSQKAFTEKNSKTKNGNNLYRTIAWCAIFIPCIYFFLISQSRIPVWQDEVTFWEDTVKKSPGHAKSHLNLGYAYETRGRLHEAEREYLASIKLYPSNEAISNLKMVRLKASYLESRRNNLSPSK